MQATARHQSRVPDEHLQRCTRDEPRRLCRSVGAADDERYVPRKRRAASCPTAQALFVDSDANNNGIPDGEEDADGDGIPDGDDTDDDGDGIADDQEDRDGDGIPDVSDPDVDGDGIANADEDDDGDGIANRLDDDDDGDGILDVDENDDNPVICVGLICFPPVSRTAQYGPSGAKRPRTD